MTETNIKTKNEHKFLASDEIIIRVAFFKSVDGISAYHCIISLRTTNDNI